MPWSRQVRPQQAARQGCGGAVEQHGLDANVVVEPFQVSQVRCGGRSVKMQIGGAVPGDLQVVRGSNGGDALPFGGRRTRDRSACKQSTVPACTMRAKYGRS